MHKTIFDIKDSKLISFGPFDLIIDIRSLFFHIQVFDNRSSKIFSRELSNEEITDLTQNLCNSHQELYSLYVSGLTNKTKNSEISISEKGVLSYKCTLTFPIDRVYKFDLELHETEMSELEKLEFQIKKLGSKLTTLQNLMSEKNKITMREENYHNGFSMVLNSGYYSFANHYKSITRNMNDNKIAKTVWGKKALEKKMQQSFSIKIEKINSEVDNLYAFIGIGYSLHHGLNIFNCKGAYCITNGKACIDGKEILMNDFLFLGDVIKVILDFERKEVIWFRNNLKIFNVGLIPEEVINYEIYPIVSLSYFNETVSFI